MSSPPASLATPILLTAPLVKQSTFMTVIWIGTAISSIALVFRYWIRIKCFRRLLPDDYITGLAWILLLTTAILWQIIAPDLYETTEVGAGVRMPSINFVANVERFMKGSLAVLFLFYVGLWTIKLNFLVFFYKLGDQITYYRISWWIVTIFTTCAGFVCIGTIQWTCLTADFAWANEHCRGSGPAVRFQDITLKFNCALDVFTDALIISLPISVLWNVRISLKRRLALAGLFSLVIITIIVAIIRVSVVTGAAADGRTSKQVEQCWLYMWHFIESSVALLVVCLASFRALFANKERSREMREALDRERAVAARAGKSIVALKARAQLFQDSLFNTKGSNETCSDMVAEVPLQSFEIVERKLSNTCVANELQVEEYSFENLHDLNIHGLPELAVDNKY